MITHGIRPPQRRTREGIVVCAACDHQAFHHTAGGCTFCGCVHPGTAFDYTTQELPMPESPEPLLQFFRYDHLPEPLQSASQPFCALARHVVETYPRNPERTVALRKLLEAKDCAVRALLYEAVS